MKKLSKEQAKRHSDIAAEVIANKEKLTEAIAKYNAARADAFAEVTSAVEALNAELNNARELRDEIVSDMENYTSERSEKWAEGEAASTFADWQGAWEGLELDDIEVDEPEDIEDPDTSFEDFDQAPTDAGML
jgi:Zn-dependent M32 family carboxypeptidase